jgi:hypothetical protein
MPDLKLYYRTIVRKNAWYLYSYRQVDKWNRSVDPEMNPYTYGYFIFAKKLKSFNEKNTAFSTNCANSTGS